MDNLLRHLKSAYALQEDWHAKGAELSFSYDGSRNAGAAGRQAGLDEQHVVPCLHLTARGRKILLTLHSLKQLCEEVGLAEKAVTGLLESRPSLLSDILNCLFKERSADKEWLLRLRLGTIDGNSCWLLRAFLDKGYNRLDNIHLIDGLREFCKRTDMEFSRFAFDGNQLFLYMINPLRPEGFLTEVGDKFCSGVSITNSEINKRNVIEVDFYFERLICTNGMTVQDRNVAGLIHKSVPLNTNFHNELPPYPLLNEDLRQQIREYVLDSLESFFKKLPAAQRLLIDLASHLSERRFEDESEEEAIKDMLRRMNATRDIDVNDVVQFLEKEKRDFKGHQNNYWLIYNAILRYISHRMLIADPPLIYMWHLGRKYQRKAAGRKATYRPPAPRARPAGPPPV